MRRVLMICVFLFFVINVSDSCFAATAKTLPLRESKEMYEHIAGQFGLPWHLLAAVDRYDQTIASVIKAKVPLSFPAHLWFGDWRESSESSIPSALISRQFWGIAEDGNGDGIADPDRAEDRLTALAYQLNSQGNSEEDRWIAVWERYRIARGVERVMQFDQLYEQIPLEKLTTRTFPLVRAKTISFKDTWGGARGWGGKRSHEGTDLFAGHGTTVQSTCYGIVETIGWNNFGGWRIGIRDIQNVYHYFAHLSSFSKSIKKNDLVKPGQVIGWVGSTGYGKPGTSGKFPPHLHFGMYRDRGQLEWAFNPYPELVRWKKAPAVRPTAALHRTPLKR